MAKHNGNSNELSYPANTNALRLAMAKQQPIKIPMGYEMVMSGPFSNAPNRLNIKAEDSDIYIICANGYYYQSDSKGNILSYSKFVQSQYGYASLERINSN